MLIQEGFFMSIRYQKSLAGIEPLMLNGFFVDWAVVPSPEEHFRILRESSHIELAVEETSSRVIGFANAISDGFFSAFIPMVEVLPEFQNAGIGSTLLQRMFAQLEDFYSIDLSCDAKLKPYYKRFGMFECTSMSLRNFEYKGD